MLLAITLKTPTYERISVLLVGGPVEISCVILCGRTVNFSKFNFQPSMLSDLGQITLLTGENVKLFSWKRNGTRYLLL